MPIENKLIENRLRWFKHVHRRPKHARKKERRQMKKKKIENFIRNDMNDLQICKKKKKLSATYRYVKKEKIALNPTKMARYNVINPNYLA